jgi:uncharacterized protein (DUF1778 family)
MTAVRFDMLMEQEDKDALSRAASLLGITMASFVRMAAREKASELLEREARLHMTAQDFRAFAAAINQPFAPNVALQQAMQAAHGVGRA